MARPQSPDYDKRREAILAAAARLYAARGFQGASVADLAKACSTPKSLIYHYFPSKDDILYMVCDRIVSEYQSQARKAIDTSHGPRDRVRSAVRAVSEAAW